MREKNSILSLARKNPYRFKSLSTTPYNLCFLMETLEIANIKSVNWLQQDLIREQNSLMSEFSNKFSLRHTLNPEGYRYLLPISYTTLQCEKDNSN